ncbi:MAG: hypothetical protein GX452_04435 [Ignavibacteriales bacterium]|nr:hypothetical protein [Ignavibacteriales bacterium]
MKFEIEVMNAEEVKKSLIEIADKTKLSNALQYCGELVVNYAKQNHTFKNRTTNLEKSIHEEAHEIAGVLEEWVIAGMPYASFVEFGTSRMAAKPFLVPALEANKDTIIRILSEVLK